LGGKHLGGGGAEGVDAEYVVATVQILGILHIDISNNALTQ